MNRFRTAALLLPLLLVCCSSQSTDTVSSLLIGSWVLTEAIPDSEGDYDRSECRVTFTTERTITGSDPCNSLGGRYTLTSTTIDMTVGGTKVGCRGSNFRDYLNDAVSYSFENERSGIVLRLETPGGYLKLRQAPSN